MKALLLFFLFVPPILGQVRQADSLATLRAQCVPSAPESTLRAIISVESGGNTNAMQIDFPKRLLARWNLMPGTLRLKRQPTTTREGQAWLAYFTNYNIFVDVGLMQVSTAQAQKLGIQPETLFEPCTNLRIGWKILEDAYAIEVKTYGPGQTALAHAISRYNTGNTQQGIDNGYLGRVMAAARHLQETKP